MRSLADARSKPVRLTVGDTIYHVAEGQSVMAALLANGVTIVRQTHRTASSRGMFCGIGVCFDCVLTIDGRAGVRACLEPVKNGMVIGLAPGGAR